MSYVQANVALLREFFGLRSDRSFLQCSYSLPLVFLLCSAIGFARLYLSVQLGVNIHPKWYVMDPDIILLMVVYPFHILMVGAMCIHWYLNRVAGASVPYQALFALFFYFQIAHLLAPFVDKLGLRLGVPFFFPYWMPHTVSDWFNNALYMTAGILLSWLVALYLTVRVLKSEYQLKLTALLGIAVITYLALIVPVHNLFPTFNTLANLLLGLPNGPANAYWGYGIYFVVTSLLGVIYFRRQTAQ